MSFSPCPFCHQDIRSSELEWHANNHFVDEELAKDMELAQQIALASTSPPRTPDNQMDDDNYIELFTGENPTTSSSIHNARMIDHGDTLNQENISCLVSLQIRSTFYKVEGGLMALLRRCLELETGSLVSIISGDIDHFQSVQSEDTGWGCGWRNIQMLCSNLLWHRQKAREVLFGGSGFIPDIPSLQRWLEIAWERGFDMLGSSQLDHNVYGTTKWIGATECATLFRSFGLRARIVDFGSKEIESLFLSVNGAKRGAKGRQLNNRDKRKVEQVYGPMDKFLHGRHGGVNQAELIRERESKHIGIHGGDLPSTSTHRNNDNCTDADADADHELNKRLTGKLMGHQVLMDWVWNYFAEEKFKKSSNSQRVIVSERTPLYFQHDGHSRTIVGIQVKETQPGISKQYTLLILDPGHRTDVLERSLKRNAGWQKLIKRGVHTLKKPQYQLCYIDPGIADEKEMEHLKTIDSIYFES